MSILIPNINITRNRDILNPRLLFFCGVSNFCNNIEWRDLGKGGKSFLKDFLRRRPYA